MTTRIRPFASGLGVSIGAVLLTLVGLAPCALAQTAGAPDEPVEGEVAPATSSTGASAAATTTPSTGTPTEPSASTPADTAASSSSGDPEGSGETEATDDFSERWVALGLKTGLYVPSVVNDMGPHVTVAIEATLLLPFVARRIGVMLEIGWSPPGASGSEANDPRLGDAGGPWTYDMTTQELFLSLGPVVRFLPPGSTFVPYLGFLGRLYLLETSVEGTGGGQAFGENTEHSTQVGFVALGGGELRLGPGAALLEISFGYSSLPHRITGDTSTGALTVELGYRLFL